MGEWGGAGSIMKNGAPEMVHTLFAVVPDKDAEFFTAGADGESSGSLSPADMLQHLPHIHLQTHTCADDDAGMRTIHSQRFDGTRATRGGSKSE